MEGLPIISDAYGVKAIPHMFIIGPDGKIAAIHRGYREDALDEIVTDINELLVEVQRGRSDQDDTASGR